MKYPAESTWQDVQLPHDGLIGGAPADYAADRIAVFGLAVKMRLNVT